MKTIVRTYVVAAALVAVASFSYVNASTKAALHRSSTAPALALDCCDDPPPCGLPDEPPCPGGPGGN